MISKLQLLNATTAVPFYRYLCDEIGLLIIIIVDIDINQKYLQNCGSGGISRLP